MVECGLCGAQVASLAAHLAEIARRRRLFGAGWGLTGLKAGYNPLDDDDNVETEPAIPYTRAAR
jgi:hypothetical protein